MNDGISWGIVVPKIIGWIVFAYVLIVLVSKTRKKSPFVFSKSVICLLFALSIFLINFDEVSELKILGGLFEARLKESSDTLDEIQKLKVQYNRDLKELQKMTRYNIVAMMGPEGCVGEWCRNDGLNALLRDTIQAQGNRKSYKCDESSRQKYIAAIELNTDFPFSYYAEAECLIRAGDSAYKNFANNAKEILYYTTRVPGHHPAHDEIYRVVNGWEIKK